MVIIDYVLLLMGLLVLASILLTKIFHNIGIPTLLLFIGVGILAGSEGLGNIYFDDAELAQAIGTICLVIILFTGGLDTNWNSSKKAFLPSLSLATLGVFLTAIIVACVIHFIFKFSFLWSFLVASIISSTDAAAVFSVLRQKEIGLKGNLKPLLELESGSNDPMAIFLTIGTIELLNNPEQGYFNIVLVFVAQMFIGSIVGLFLGKLMVYSINRLKFSNAGIYTVYVISFCALIYSTASIIGGSGFLALYIGGVIIGNSQFVYKKSTIRFFDSLAILSQITMFTTLGLLVFPSKLINVVGIGLLIGFALMFIARPISVFISLIPFKYSVKDKIFVSWVGLRAAVPIILATFPLLAQIERADLIFNVVFFIVVLSTILQGWTINPIAKLLKLSTDFKKTQESLLEINPSSNSEYDILELILPFNSLLIGKQIVDINMSQNSRIVLILRNDKHIMPTGETVLESGDTLMILYNKEQLDHIKNIFSV